MSIKRATHYTPNDFGYYLRTRECSVLAAGELNRQIRSRVFREDDLAKIFLMDRRRKPSKTDAKRLHEDISDFLSICGRFYRAAAWLKKNSE